MFAIEAASTHVVLEMRLHEMRSFMIVNKGISETRLCLNKIFGMDEAIAARFTQTRIIINVTNQQIKKHQN